MAAIRANEIKFDHYLAPALGPGILNMWHVVEWEQLTLSQTFKNTCCLDPNIDHA